MTSYTRVAAEEKIKYELIHDDIHIIDWTHVAVSFVLACGHITLPVSYGKYVLSNNGLTISEKCSDGFTETSVDMYRCTEGGWLRIRNESACGPLGKKCIH